MQHVIVINTHVVDIVLPQFELIQQWHTQRAHILARPRVDEDHLGVVMNDKQMPGCRSETRRHAHLIV